MKRIIVQTLLVLALATTFVSFKSATKSDAEVLVVLNTASWCPTCQANAERVENDVLELYSDNESFKLIINDLSNEESKKASKNMLEEAGLADFAKKNKSTGYLHFINAENLELLSSISVSEDTEKITAAFSEALEVAKE
ncbi:hypothetical protein GYB22_12585 [bacterium]|nr:hypothetical protein [bacterium]